MSNRFLGVLLIVIGLIVTMGNLGWLQGGSVLILIGAGFLALYAVRGAARRDGNLGLLIPGTILVMIGVFVAISEGLDVRQATGSLFFFCLSLAFGLVYLIHTRHQTAFGPKYWPAITGASILVFAALLLSVEAYQSETGKLILNHASSLALVVAGLIILLRSRGKHQ